MYSRHGNTVFLAFFSLSLLTFSLIALTKYYPQKSQFKQKNLLKGGHDEEEEEQVTEPIKQDDSTQEQQVSIYILS